MKAIVTGSFDPITLGHIELIKYASRKYDQVYVVALVNENKEYMFTMEQKKALIQKATKEFHNVIADAYVGLTADYMHKNGISHIVRGVRNEQDMAYEENLAQKMKEFDSDFATEIVSCEEKYANISSSNVREKIINNEPLDDMLPKEIINLLNDFYQENKNAR